MPGRINWAYSLWAYLLLAFLLPFNTTTVNAKDTGNTISLSPANKSLRINCISFSGNKITRDFILQRELTIQSGDTITESQIDDILETNRTRILNLQLFAMADASIPNQTDTSIDIHFTVREILYWLPSPIFALADRNFNVWWVEQHHNLARTNIGIDITRINFRGRDERLNLLMQLGYNKLFNLAYRIPYINKAMTIGLNAGFTYATGRETFFTTHENRLHFYNNNDEFPYQQTQARIGASYRGGYAGIHDVLLSWNKLNISDDLFALNPNYLGGEKKMAWWEMQYNWQYNRTDARIYPTRGLEWKAKLLYRGFSNPINFKQAQAYAEVSWYKSIIRRWSWSSHARARISYANQTPYFFNRALGFQSGYVRGYEYYVVDGAHYALMRHSMRYQIINKVFKQSLVPIMTHIPLRIFAKMYDDVGWAYENGPLKQSLNNRVLHGYGLGIDILVSYFARLRIEYSFNHFGEKGLFLHGNKE